MKSLIGGMLILLALYAQAASADERQARFIVLSSAQQTGDGQYSSVQPTLYVPLSSPRSGLVFFRSLNRDSTTSDSGVKRNFNSQHYGLGFRHQVNSWMITQVVVQSQQYNRQSSGYESMFNVNVFF